MVALVSKMRIALIAVKNKNPGSPFPFLGLLHIASFLISKKVIKKEEIKIFDTLFDEILEDLKFFKPDIVGFSAVTPLYLATKEYAMAVKKKFRGAKIIIGGPHISSMPESLEEPFDFGIIGEGEETFAELVSILKKNKKPPSKILQRIRGIVFRDVKSGLNVATQRRPLIKNLDKLTHIDWSLIPHERVSRYSTIVVDGKPKSVNLAFVYTARGCPYHCVFCAENVVWGQRGVRYFSPRYVRKEIETLYKNYHVDCIQILDDVFGMPKKHVLDLISELRKHRLLGKIYFHNLFARADQVDEEYSLLLKELGIGAVFIGIESGSQRMLDFLKNKTLTVSQVKKAILILGKVKIGIIGSFMLFSPGEKMDDLKKTLGLARWLSSLENAFCTLFWVTTPYPQTKLWEIAADRGLIGKEHPRWDEFLVYDSVKATIPTVFFRNNLTARQCQKIWQDAFSISKTIDRKKEKISGWNEANRRTEKNNAYLDFLGRIRKRAFRLKHQPLSVLVKLILKPYKLYDVIKDIFFFPFDFVKLKFIKEN